MRFLQHSVRRKAAAVSPHRIIRRVKTEMPGERESNAHLRSQLRAVIARAQKKNRRQRPIVRHRPNGTKWIAGRKFAAAPSDQLPKLFQKIVSGKRLARATQR